VGNPAHPVKSGGPSAPRERDPGGLPEGLAPGVGRLTPGQELQSGSVRDSDGVVLAQASLTPPVELPRRNHRTMNLEKPGTINCAPGHRLLQ
jgi:hypothetical protein